MMDLPVVSVPTIGIAGWTERFPVRRIFCVGQNYAAHTREMGGDPDRQQPFFFAKPADAVVASGAVLPFPLLTADLHHEVELVLALGGGGSNLSVETASALIFGHAVGLDLTRRDLQAAAKATGRPWDMAKGFDQSAPIGLLRRGPPPASGAITLTVNGEVRQTGDLAQMVWNPAEIIAALSGYVALAAGDLIFTGTPAGVGPIHHADRVRGMLDGVEAVEVLFAA
ncbi:MAG: fumarylacetoacetate hydrolase family protein [Polymorphobacter sp.]